MSNKPLRTLMPQVAAFVDGLRVAFGADEVDAMIARGLAGEPVFFAEEAGYAVGTLASAELNAWRDEGMTGTIARGVPASVSGRSAATARGDSCCRAAPLQHIGMVSRGDLGFQLIPGTPEDLRCCAVWVVVTRLCESEGGC
jgi:hypothetical protein